MSFQQMYTRGGFGDFFSDLPIVNETVDFIGDTTDFVQDPSAGDFFEIVTPAITEDFFDGGGLDDFGFLPGPIDDIIDGDGFQIPFGPTIGPNAPTSGGGAPPDDGLPLNPDTMNPDTGVPQGYCQQPLFPEPTYFGEKDQACGDEVVTICTLKNWIDEKAKELRTLRDKHDIRMDRYEKECGPFPGCEKPGVAAPASTACAGCGGGSTSPCGCGGGAPHDHPVEEDDPFGDMEDDVIPTTSTTKPKPSSRPSSKVKCTRAVIEKCCPRKGRSTSKKTTKKSSTKTTTSCGVATKKKTVTKASKKRKRS